MDLLIGVDDILFLCEAKSGKFSAGAKRGAPESLAKELSSLVIEGQRQSERAERYVNSSDNARFYDSSGSKQIISINRARYRKIFRIVITREQLGWVGAKIAMLSVLYPALSKSYPWHVSIDDLRIVSELFRNDEIRFVHYLGVRLLASAQPALKQSDEIEHIGLYNKLHYYHDIPAKGISRYSYDAAYMRDIDYYLMARVTGEPAVVPTQTMPSKVREFMTALTISRLSQRFEVGELVLSIDKDGREKFSNGLETLDAKANIGRSFSVRIPFTEHRIGISVSYTTGSGWQKELKNSAVLMELGSCYRWLAVQVTNNSSYAISSIEVITPGRFTDQELMEFRIRNEAETRTEINRKKPGRNETCPCGSGKKYKRCHGS